MVHTRHHTASRFCSKQHVDHARSTSCQAHLVKSARHLYQPLYAASCCALPLLSHEFAVSGDASCHAASALPALPKSFTACSIRQRHAHTWQRHE
jgi:hypothetical protein